MKIYRFRFSGTEVLYDDESQRAIFSTSNEISENNWDACKVFDKKMRDVYMSLGKKIEFSDEVFNRIFQELEPK